MKKRLSLILATGLILTSLTACGGSSDTQPSTASSNSSSSSSQSAPESQEQIQIIATTFPQYDWLREIIGEDNEAINLTLLLDSGVDLHSYSPTVAEVATIASADLFIHVGGVSDGWVEDVVSESTNADQVVLNEVAILGSAVKMEESVEGMESGGHDHSEDEHDEDEHDHAEDEHDHAEDEHDHAEEEHDHAEEEHDHDEEEHDHDEEEHDHDEEEHDHDEEEHDHDEDEHAEEGHAHNHEDEHVWLSLKNAKEICTSLTAALCDLVPEQAEVFESNLEAYLEKLSDLDAEYEAAVNAADQKVILVADRFPFRYLVDDYGIDYYAAFSGCSAETEASFETIAFLAGKIDELSLSVVLAVGNSSHEIPETVVGNSSSQSQEILYLNSMEGTTLSDASSQSYLSIMAENLEVLKEALQ